MFPQFSLPLSSPPRPLPLSLSRSPPPPFPFFINPPWAVFPELFFPFPQHPMPRHTCTPTNIETQPHVFPGWPGAEFEWIHCSLNISRSTALGTKPMMGNTAPSIQRAFSVHHLGRACRSIGHSGTRRSHRDIAIHNARTAPSVEDCVAKSARRVHHVDTVLDTVVF